MGILTLISALERLTNQTLTDLTSVLCGLRIYHYYRKGHLFTVGYFEGPTSIQKKGKSEASQEALAEEKQKGAFLLPSRLSIFTHRTLPKQWVKLFNVALPFLSPKSPGYLVLTCVSGIMGLSSGDVLYRVERGVARMRGLGRTRPVR